MPRRLGTLLAYWILACASAFALFHLGLNQARLLVPLGRALLVDRANGWSDLRSGRRWAEALGLTLAWGWVPWLIDLSTGQRLMNAGLHPFWMPGGVFSGSGVWWWLGVAVYFGLLHRRLLAGLLGGTFALLFQWAFLRPMAHEWLRPLIPSDMLIGYLMFGLFMGLALGLADFLAGWKKSAPNRM